MAMLSRGIQSSSNLDFRLINPRIIRHLLPVFILVLLLVHQASADGRWIGVAEPSRPNQWIAFRTSVSIDRPAEISASIAIDSKYWLYVDGELVVFEGGLKRGPSPNSTYVDNVDLSSSLGPGDHEIAVLVWHFGKDGFSHKNSGQAGLWFELRERCENRDRILLESDQRWHARVHPAFGDTEPPHPNFRLPESNIQFDANLEPVQWTTANVEAWPAAVEFGDKNEQPWGNLVPRPIPMWKDFGIKSYVNANDLRLPRTSDGQPIRCQLPYNAQVTPTMTVRGPAGETIRIQTDNYTGGSAPNVRGVYVTCEGRQTYESLGWMNGHEVIYDIPAGVEVIELGFRETGFDTEVTGTFQCDDPFLNRLRQKAVRTLYITMRDTYFDCPDRERAQWWGDAVLEMGEAFYALDPRSHSLAKKGILELMNWQRDDKTIFSPIPAGNYSDELPMQMLASVGRYGFATYALHSGDLETVETVYDRVTDYLSIWQVGDDGLVVARKGGWTWGDWGDNKDMPLLYNAWYYLALDGRQRMAEMLGRDDDASNMQARMDSLRDKFNETFWTGTQYRSPDYQGHTDDRGQALAVVSGIANPSQYDAITEVLRRQRHASPYMEKYVLEALFQMQQPEFAIKRMKERWGKMVESDLTTLWEGWGIGSEGFGGGTINHAWSGGPLTLMSQCIVGIEPTSLGYKTITVEPQLGPLEQASAHVDTVSGPIDVSVRKLGDGLEITIECDPRISGIAKFPGGSEQTFRGGDKIQLVNAEPVSASEP